MWIVLKDSLESHRIQMPDGETLAIGDVITERRLDGDRLVNVRSFEVIRRHWGIATGDKEKRAALTHYDVRTKEIR